MNRREFLKTGAGFGGSLVLGFCFPFSFPGPAWAETGTSFSPNAFIRIDQEGTVTFIVNKSELGQGAYTALPMLIAEELECDLKSVRIEAAPVDPAYNSIGMPIQLTAGSGSIKSEWERLSKAGATAREMLVSAAAEIWKVDPRECRAEAGSVTHSTGKALPFGKLVEKAALMPVPKEVMLKRPEEYKIVGKAYPRLDAKPKADGSAQFGMDVKLPEMVTALIARAPVFGAKLTSFKADKAKTVPGVKEVFQVSSGVAVVATGFTEARKGIEALELSWNEGEGGKVSTDDLRKDYANLAGTPGSVAKKEGDAAGVLSKAAKKLSAEYELPYLAHAAMEPLNCVIDLKADRCEVWIGTQGQTDVRDTAARVSGLKPEQVLVHTTFVGGGFGRKASFGSPITTEAVEIAKVVKKPVKLIWTREDDMQGGYYRPMWHDRMSAGLNEKNEPVAWQHTIVGQSLGTGTPFESVMVKEGVDRTSVEGAQEIPYAIPNLFVDLHSPRCLVPVFFWRSVGNSHTGFVVESFIDEIAHATGKDPYEFRKALLKEKPRHLGVLDLAAAKSGWGTPHPQGYSRGIAVHASFGSFVAQVAEVSVSLKGEIKVHKVVCAIDCGRYVNPDTIAAQMEGGIAFGLSAAIHGAITIKAGRVEQTNFHDYPILRMSEMPQVEVHIVPSPEKPGGVGEPGVPPIAAAVANAVFAATKARIRTLPMTPEKVLKAMKG